MAYCMQDSIEHTTMHTNHGIFMGKHITDALNIGDLKQHTLSEHTISDVYTATTIIIVYIAKQR